MKRHFPYSYPDWDDHLTQAFPLPKCSELQCSCRHHSSNHHVSFNSISYAIITMGGMIEINYFISNQYLLGERWRQKCSAEPWNRVLPAKFMSKLLLEGYTLLHDLELLKMSILAMSNYSNIVVVALQNVVSSKPAWLTWPVTAGLCLEVPWRDRSKVTSGCHLQLLKKWFTLVKWLYQCSCA